MDQLLAGIDLPRDRAVHAQRSDALDALRAAITLLVVFHHTAIAYGAIGGWFYKEILPSDAWSSRLLVFFCTVNQAFFMGLFFLIAGYFTPGAIAAKGPWGFLKARLLRLGLPLLVFGWVLGPLTIALAQTQNGQPFLATAMYLWSKGVFEVGPLWFCEALLVFSLAAVLWQPSFGKERDGNAARQGSPSAGGPSNAQLLVAALLVGVVAFALRLFWPVGSQWHALQLGYFASYVVLFVAGMDAARTRWIERPAAQQVRLWRRVMWTALPVLPVLALAAQRLPALAGRPEGGWNLLAAVYAFWEPLVAWGLILGLLSRFHSRLKPGPRWRELSSRAYAIFIIHPPVVVAVTIAFGSLALPALCKFALTGATSCVLCYLLAGWLRAVPGVRRVV